MVRSLPPGACIDPAWRVGACTLLRISAEEREALAKIFDGPGTTDEQRFIILDLLAGAGTFDAQVVLRRLLALAVARRESRTYAEFVQRLAFVECPDGQTLRFLMSVYAESRGGRADVQAACAYALGAAAGRALRADADAAVRASEVLRRNLLSAVTTFEKCSLLAALGNAGVPSDVPLIVRCSHDREPVVRAAAALALRKMSVAPASARLLALVVDDERVARNALSALGEHKLEEGHVAQLAMLVLEGRIAPGLRGAILRVFAARRAEATSSSALLATIEQALRMLLGGDGPAHVPEAPGSGERLARGERPGVRGGETHLVKPWPRVAGERRGPEREVALAGRVIVEPWSVEARRVEVVEARVVELVARPMPSLPVEAPRVEAPRDEASRVEPVDATVGSALAAVDVPQVATAPTVFDKPLDRDAAPTGAQQAPLASAGASSVDGHRASAHDAILEVRERLISLGLDPDERSSSRRNRTRLGPFGNGGPA